MLLLRYPQENVFREDCRKNSTRWGSVSEFKNISDFSFFDSQGFLSGIFTILGDFIAADLTASPGDFNTADLTASPVAGPDAGVIH
jgi:hypothetical protein